MLLLPLVAYFAYLGRPVGRYGRGRAWAALILRCLIALLIVLSLAGAQSVHGGDELAVVFLVDVSDSVPEADREQALAFVEESLAEMGPDDRAALVLFGADALVERPMMGGGELGAVASIPHTHQTVAVNISSTGNGVTEVITIIFSGEGQSRRALNTSSGAVVNISLPLILVCAHNDICITITVHITSTGN